MAFEHLEAAEKEIALDRSLQSGIVTVSASESALHCFLLPILRNYRQQYPGVHIQVVTDSTPDAISALKNGLADLSLVSTPMPSISGLKKQLSKPSVMQPSAEMPSPFCAAEHFLCRIWLTIR